MRLLGRALPIAIVASAAGFIGGQVALAEHPDQLTDAVRQAFLETHEGWSSDEVLLQDDLNANFLQRCQSLAPQAAAWECNWCLLNLRKAGKLTVTVTKRRRDSHDEYRHLAEIAARLMHDRHKTSTDRIMSDPELREEFDATARKLAANIDPYLLRKGAFGLRKARKLRPELVVRIADWDRRISTVSAADVVAPGGDRLVPPRPGIYIFRDSSGYLYIGESKNLRRRVLKHLDGSDRASLASYLQQRGLQHDLVVELHAFDPTSRAKEVMIRRAYESELIASRKPRFNLQP